MGSIMSSERYEVPEALAVKLVELGDVFCTAGDNEVGQLLKELCHSPDRILSLRTALVQIATSSKKSAINVSDNEWLGKFVSTAGQSLEDGQQQKLLRLFGQWSSGPNVNKLEADALSWCGKPSTFCETAPQSHTSSRSELVGVYFEEYECIENAHIRNRPRRRAILLETFRAIKKEEQRLQKTKQRKADSQTNSSAPIRTRAVGSIASRLWGERFSPAEFKRRKARLLRMSRYGEKWSLLEPKGILLALGGESQFFEQQKWSTIEIEAMNKYVKEMSIYSIQPTLERAMVAITGEWSRQVQDQQVNRRPLATSNLNKSINIQPTNETSDVSPANFPEDGLQILLDAAPVPFNPWGNAISTESLNQINPWENAMQISFPNQIDPWGNAVPVSFPGPANTWGNAIPVHLLNHISTGGETLNPSTPGQPHAWNDVTIEYSHQPITALEMRGNETLVPVICP